MVGFRMLRAIAVACAIAGGLLAIPAAAALRVVYPASESNGDARSDYPVAVLALALSRSGRDYALRPLPAPGSQRRVLRMLEHGRELDVAWAAPTAERERTLRAIRFPIDRGLLGWRVLLVRRDQEGAFAQVRTAGQLRRLRGVQGHDWPDLLVLRHAGLAVDAGTRYDGMFSMLARGHIDYFPRSVLEIGAELARPQNADLAVEPTLLLRYPSALYFFVHRDNAALAGALTDGLARAQADGLLQALFQRTYGEALATLALDARHTIALPNPTWPAPHADGRNR